MFLTGWKGHAYLVSVVGRARRNVSRIRKREIPELVPSELAKLAKFQWCTRRSSFIKPILDTLDRWGKLLSKELRNWSKVFFFFVSWIDTVSRNCYIYLSVQLFSKLRRKAYVLPPPRSVERRILGFGKVSRRNWWDQGWSNEKVSDRIFIPGSTRETGVTLDTFTRCIFDRG